MGRWVGRGWMRRWIGGWHLFKQQECVWRGTLTQMAYTGSINYDVLNLLVNESGLLHPYFGQSIRETLGQRAGLGLPPSTV